MCVCNSEQWMQLTILGSQHCFLDISTYRIMNDCLVIAIDCRSAAIGYCTGISVVLHGSINYAMQTHTKSVEAISLQPATRVVALSIFLCLEV